MKQLILLFFGIILLSKITSAQCYIQYTYDASGNRTKREYVGGCAILKPASNNEQIQMVADTLVVLQTENRAELIRQDMDGQIRCYPNPSSGLFQYHIEHLGEGWSYNIASMSGQVVSKSYVTSNDGIVDITELNAAAYYFILYDERNQVIYKTKILKQ